MKKIITLLFGLLVIYSCNQPKTASEQKIVAVKATIDTLLTNWHKDAAEANYEHYFGALDSISVYIGTDATEHWTKKQFSAFCKPYFDRGKAWDFKTLERNIYVSKTADFVWFDELLTTWMGTCRGSGVLEQSDQGWKIKHYVLSIEIPNEDVNAVIKVKAESDSIFLYKFIQ